MKTTSYIFAIALSALFWIGTGCGNEHAHDHDGEATEHNHDDHADHDHATEDDHADHSQQDHDVSTGSNANSKVAHGNGRAYTAMYVCPMHCAGSGGNEAGNCPTCGMEYVRFRDHVRDGHHHRDN